MIMLPNDMHGELYCVVCWHEWVLDEEAESIFGCFDCWYFICCICRVHGYLPIGEKKVVSMVLGKSYAGYATVMVNDVAVNVYGEDKNIHTLPKRITMFLSAVSVHELAHLFSRDSVIDKVPKEFWIWLVI